MNTTRRDWVSSMRSLTNDAGTPVADSAAGSVSAAAR
jgi:hypothetical protein